MGCDIHLHTEVKINGKWEHYSAPSLDRDYELFGKMAGIRSCDTDPIALPRGLPADVAAVTEFDYKKWGVDAHTPSWLSADEIDQLCAWANSQYPDTDRPWLDWETKQVGYLFGNSWSGFTKYPGDRPEGLEDIRWVFWFDN